MTLVVLLLLGIFCALALIAWRQIAGEKSFNRKWFNMRRTSSEIAETTSKKGNAFLPRVKKNTAKVAEYSAVVGTICGLPAIMSSLIWQHSFFWLVFGVPAYIALFVFICASCSFVLAALVHTILTILNSFTSK